MPYKKVILTVDYSVRVLCFQPYPNHPKGCPNYGNRLTCPPQALLIENILDLSGPIYVIWSTFDFASHIERMKALHPKWTERQLVCCLYWQPRARKMLECQIESFKAITFNELHVLRCPEACGINVTETMASIGERLEWPPRTKTYQVAIAGWRR